MSDLLRIKRGLKSDLPELMQGEFGYCYDTRELFIGGTNGNDPVNIKNNYNIMDFGAVGNGIIDSTANLQLAINAAYLVGASVWIPNGVFVITGVIDLKVSIYGTGTLKFKNNVTGHLRVPVGYNGLTIQDITIDGDVLSTGSLHTNYVGNMGIENFADDTTIINVKVKNTNGTGIWNSGHRLIVAYCDIKGARNEYGDGIYSQNADDCQILYNYVHDFTRIGIVFDGVQGKSKNPLIQGNVVFNAHDAGVQNGGTELNGGIWVENVHGAKIIDNTIKQTNMRGIVVVPLISDSKTYHYIVEGNTITDVEMGIHINDGSTNNLTLAEVDVINNAILGSYQKGIAFGKHCNINFDKIHFGSSSNVMCLFISDMLGFVERSNIVISQCTKGVIGYSDSTVKDIHLYNAGKFDITIKDMVGQWSYDMPDAQINGRFKVINTDLIFDSSILSRICNFIGFDSIFDNCKIVIATDQTVSANTPDIEFRNCRFYSNSGVIRPLAFAYSCYKVTFVNCRFDKIYVWDIVENPSGNFSYFFKDTSFNDYGAAGAFKAETISYSTMDMRFLECTFKDSGNAVPIKRVGNPTRCIIRNAISPTASAAQGFTPTSETNTIVV